MGNCTSDSAPPKSAAAPSPKRAPADVGAKGAERVNRKDYPVQEKRRNTMGLPLKPETSKDALRENESVKDSPACDLAPKDGAPVPLDADLLGEKASPVLRSGVQLQLNGSTNGHFNTAASNTPPQRFGSYFASNSRSPTDTVRSGRSAKGILKGRTDSYCGSTAGLESEDGSFGNRRQSRPLVMFAETVSRGSAGSDENTSHQGSSFVMHRENSDPYTSPHRDATTSVKELLPHGEVEAMFDLIDSEHYRKALRGLHHLLAKRAPESADSLAIHLALGTLHGLGGDTWSRPDLPFNHTEAELRRTESYLLALDGRKETGSPAALLAVAEMYAMMKDGGKREAHFKALAAERGHPLAVLRNTVAILVQLRKEKDYGTLPVHVYDLEKEKHVRALAKLAEGNSRVAANAGLLTWVSFYKGTDGLQQDLNRSKELLERAIRAEQGPENGRGLMKHLKRVHKKMLPGENLSTKNDTLNDTIMSIASSRGGSASGRSPTDSSRRRGTSPGLGYSNGSHRAPPKPRTHSEGEPTLSALRRSPSNTPSLLQRQGSLRSNGGLQRQGSMRSNGGMHRHASTRSNTPMGALQRQGSMRSNATESMVELSVNGVNYYSLNASNRGMRKKKHSVTNPNAETVLDHFDEDEGDLNASDCGSARSGRSGRDRPRGRKGSMIRGRSICSRLRDETAASQGPGHDNSDKYRSLKRKISTHSGSF
ncbi:hypothetical protein DIPPA_33827 [Diplonema papillatum]|nr:hypothetical protein DIPPA_33827 [Diplonema papillatum]